MPLGRILSGLTFLRCPLIGHTHKVGGDSLVSVFARIGGVDVLALQIRAVPID